MPGKEVKNAKVGNLGLQDRKSTAPLFFRKVAYFFLERLALKWIQTYIKEFGGDPTKVTM